MVDSAVGVSMCVLTDVSRFGSLWRLLNALNVSKMQCVHHLEWKPQLKDWIVHGTIDEKCSAYQRAPLWQQLQVSEGVGGNELMNHTLTWACRLHRGACPPPGAWGAAGGWPLRCRSWWRLWPPCRSPRLSPRSQRRTPCQRITSVSRWVGVDYHAPRHPTIHYGNMVKI